MRFLEDDLQMAVAKYLDFILNNGWYVAMKVLYL